MQFLWHGLWAIPASWLICLVLRRMLKYWSILDWPGERRLHERPIPRGGGIAIVVLALIGIFQADLPRLADAWLLGAVGLSAVTGFLDDVMVLPVGWKLGLLLLTCVLALAALPDPPFIGENGLPGQARAIVSVLVLLFLLGMVNVFNFMDGSNGLTAGQSGMLLAGLLFFAAPADGLARLAGIVLGAVLGFLPWNFPRPRLFLGDVGSLTLGLLAAVLLLGYWLSGHLQPAAVLLLPAVFLGDAGATLVWRVWSGKPWYRAHTDHLYQQLVLNGWSHTRVWLLYMLLNAVLIWPAVWLVQRRPDWQWPVMLGVAALLGGGWIVLQQRCGGLRRQGRARA